MANDLHDLLEEDAEVTQYFLSLPGYVQDAISGRADEICTVEELQRYADNLLENI